MFPVPNFARSVFLLAIFSLTLTTAEARYYTVREVETHCRNQGRNGLQGAGIGALVGCGLGVLMSGGRGRGCAPGAAVGAVTGGLLGIASSCEDEVRYVSYWDRGIDRRPMSRNYENWGDGCQGRVIFEGRHRHTGQFCREYETYVSTPRGYRYHRSVACRDGHGWRHGYQRMEITTVVHRRTEPRRFRHDPLMPFADSAEEFDHDEFDQSAPAR